jgi:eukaryotic-like serine/threonine-protein kinase
MNYGRYQIVAELGRGSMGVVYKAYDPQIDRTIALKVLREDRVTSDDFVRRFLKEAMAVGRLSHPGIVTVYDVGQDHGSIYIAMEFLQGTPLDELMAARKFTLEEIIAVGIQAVRALNYAHQHGIVHRDIKPPNIIYSPEGSIRVTDFGIARIEDPGGHQMTQVGEILGTPLYMSPEQVMGQTLDGRSDMYSLGVILYQLTTGRRPFQETTLAAIFRAITQDTPPPPHTLDPAVPESLSSLIMKLLDKDPARRYSDGDSLVEAFEACLPPRSPSTKNTPPPLTPAEKKGAGKIFIFGLAALILCAAGLGGYYFLRQPSKPPSPSLETSTPQTDAVTPVKPDKQQDATVGSSSTTSAANRQEVKQASLKTDSRPPGADRLIDDSSGGTPLETPVDRDSNELIRQGTALSVTITDLPKKEMVLKSALELGKVSPRYQEDVKIAENTYNNVRENQRKKLDLYVKEISNLGHTYAAGQIANAMDRIKKGDLSERQKNAVDLSEEHLKSLQNGARLTAEKVLDDFSQRFSNFVD